LEQRIIFQQVALDGLEVGGGVGGGEEIDEAMGKSEAKGEIREKIDV
jgi:hypothetical protein